MIVNSKKYELWHILTTWSPIFFMSLLAYIIKPYSQGAPALLIIVTSPLFCHVSNKLLIANVTDTRMAVFSDKSLVLPYCYTCAVLTLEDYFPKILLADHSMLIIFVINFSFWYHFVHCVTLQICKELKISCFTIIKPESVQK